MSVPIIPTGTWLAQAAPKTTKPKTATTQPASSSPQAASLQTSPVWMHTAGGLLVLLVILGATSALQYRRLNKKLRFELLKNQELQKKYKFAVDTIGKMERNPDLIHSREFNLDYLRMRMAEEVFHFSIVNQMKIKVKDRITMALRPQQASQGELGIASSTGRQVDEVFDVEYEPQDAPKGTKRVLFRVCIKILKLPTQPTSQTIGQIIDCIETFLSPGHENDTWQPTIQGRIANMHWDQKAKPTPLLVLEQTQEGSNVTFRTNRMAKA
ncbi:hypothetical protein [Alkalinema sp. FACHB-956]|uniref:hypothetical protein n=1 Tax=Alkalinema sp. FACHB-956 TaxID=2692768 RepID=UPI0016869DCB|nr:hypothetical protein [Alkalinema sp. FACHB-956]MBD2325905.1 hypothetical protein [Alkalinema sp. FACHB-956]